MKTLKLLVIGTVLFLSGTLKAQVSVNVNIGSPPLWGPVGYTETRYYYLPDVQAYYDVQSSMFIYYGNGVWLQRTSLPAQYRNYDLYSGYKVVMTDYRGNTPYTTYATYKTKYAKGYRGKPQQTIGQKPGKANSGAKMSSQGQSGKQVNKSTQKSQFQGNAGPAKKSPGQGGGSGKKK